MTPEHLAPQAGRTVLTTWRPRTIFFDVGDTLMTVRRSFDQVLEEVSQQLALELPASVRAGLAVHVDACVTRRTHRRQPCTFPPSASQAFWFETYHGFLAHVLADADARRIEHAVREVFSSPSGYMLCDDTLPTLARLRADGYRLGIISNWEAWLPNLLDATGIALYFDTIVISGLCEIEKPDPRIFQLALEEGGYQPEDVVYVGDRPAHDVEPPLAVGITPILLERSGRYPDCRAPVRITSLNDLPTTLQTLRSHGVVVNERWHGLEPSAEAE